MAAEAEKTRFSFPAIGRVRSCFVEKFGTPRQAGLAPSARAWLELLPPYDAPEAVRELEQFSHVWVIYLFDRIRALDWKSTVRPPRLGGDRRVGVFASRSNFRPNPIGLSVVRLLRVEAGPPTVLELGGADLVDGTPVLDIKPYLPYADCCPEAVGGYAETPPPLLAQVRLTDAVRQFCQLRESSHPGLTALLVEVLRQDPRPAYRRRRDPADSYGLRLYDCDFRWRLDGPSAVEVFAARQLAAGDGGPKRAAGAPAWWGSAD